MSQGFLPGENRGKLEANDPANVLAGFQVVITFLHLVERVLLSDELINHELAFVVESKETGDLKAWRFGAEDGPPQLLVHHREHEEIEVH